MTSFDLEEGQEGQDPQGQGSAPKPPPGTSLAAPPPVLPRPVDEHDLEQSVKMMREALHGKSQEMDLIYLQHMAAQGQLGQYQAEQMQQATGNNMEVEADLLGQGLPFTNVRIPEQRKAYEDWFADFAARSIPATPEMAPRVDELTKRFKDFQDTAKAYDQDAEQIRSFLSPTVRAYEHGFQNFADIANSAASGLTGGYLGTTDTRVEQIAAELNDKVEELVSRRHPKMPWAAPQDDAKRESYHRLLREEAFDKLKKVADRPGLKQGKAIEWSSKAAELLGMAIPMGAAAKAGQAVTTAGGVAKSVTGRIAQHVGGDVLGFAAYGAAMKPTKDQQARIESLPPGDKAAGEMAARIENAVDFGLFAPIYSVAGVAGKAAGQAIGGLGGKMAGGAAAGVGIGAAMPVAGEVSEAIKAAGIDNIPALRDLAERRLISRPALQGPVRGMISSLQAGDMLSFWANAKEYVAHASPGMAAFGLLGLAHAAAPAGGRKQDRAPELPKKEVEQTAKEAHREVEKVAAGDEKLAEELHEAVDRKVVDLTHTEPTRRSELVEQVGPEQAKRTVEDLVAVETTKPREETKPRTEALPAEPSGASKQEALLKRRLARTKNPEKKAQVEAELAEVRKTLRDEAVKAGTMPAEAEAVKPADYASELARRGTKRLEARAELELDPTNKDADYRAELWRSSQTALRYAKLARNATSPEVKARAEARAAEWTLHGRKLEAWKATKFRGESPPPPYSDRRTAASAKEAQDFAFTESIERGMEAVPMAERAAGEALAYRGSKQRMIDEANERSERKPGEVLEDEAGNRVTVARHEAGETHGLTPEGDLVKVQEGHRVVEIGKAPEVAADPLRDAQGKVDAAHAEGRPAEREAAEVVTKAQEQAQREAVAPETPVSKDAADAAVIEAVASKSKVSTAASSVVRQAELATGRQLELPLTPKGKVPPRPAVAQLTPHTELPKETESLALAENIASEIAGSHRGPFRMLAELKDGRSERTIETLERYLDTFLSKPGVPAIFADFAKYAKANARRWKGKTGERFAAEVLNGFLHEKLGREYIPWTETLQDLTAGLRTLREELRRGGEVRLFHGWAAAEAEALTGPWSVVSRYTKSGQAVLEEVRALGDPINTQSGSIINPAEWPVTAVKAISKLTWDYRKDVRQRLMEQLSREPSTTGTNPMRQVLGGFFETPTNWGGRIVKEGIATESRSRAEIARVRTDFFHATKGLLANFKEGTPKDTLLFEVLDEGFKSDKAKETLKAAKAGDADAREVLQTAIKVRRWMRQTLKVVKDSHPQTHRLREHIRYLGKDLEVLEAERAPKLEALERSKSLAASDAVLASANKALLELKRDARKKYGSLKDAPIEVRNAARELGRQRAQRYREHGSQMPETIRGGLSAVSKRIAAMKRHRKMLEGELDSFLSNYGITNYIKHASQLEILPGGVARDLAVGKNGIAAIEARRRIYSDSTMKREDWLKEKGLLAKSGARAMWHYVHSIVPYIHRSRFLAKIDRELYGELELLTPKETVRGMREVHFGDVRAINLGLHNLAEVPFKTKRGDEVMLPTFARGAKLTPEQRAKKNQEADERRVAKAAGIELPEVPNTERVLLWIGDEKQQPTRTQLANPRWVSKHIQSDRNPSGGLVALPRSQAILRAFKGGWWERADALRQHDMVRYIDLVTGALSSQQRGMIDAELGKAMRFLSGTARKIAGVQSALLLGGFTNAHNALNNLFAATMQNAWFFGGRTEGAPRAFGQFLGRYMSHIKTVMKGGMKLDAEPYHPMANYNPDRVALSTTWDREFRTPEAQLAKMSPERAAEQRKMDDAMVGLMQSGVMGATHADHTFGMASADVRFGRIERPGAWRGEWMPARAKLEWIDGELQRVEPGIGAKLMQTIDNVAAQMRLPTEVIKRGWYALFSSTEVCTRAPAFIKGYLEGRERGNTHDQAVAEGIASVHQTQMVYTQAAKSEWMRSPAGILFGNLQNWTTHFSGRVLSLQGKDIAWFAAYSASLGAIGMALGMDWWDLFGTRVGNLPGVGEYVENKMLGVGVRTESDPAGVSPKGPLYDSGLRTVPIPLPLPVGVGPGAKVIGNLAKALAETMAGNGEAAAKSFNTARAGFDPTYSNWWKQIEKAFGEGNIPQSDGTALFIPKDSGKGSTVLTQRGWLQYMLQMLPGTDLKVAKQWQENKLAAASAKAQREAQRQFSELGKDWTSAMLEARSGDPAARAIEEQLRAEVMEQAKALGKKVSYATWHDTWLRDAEWERHSDMRLRAAIGAPDKVSKLREFTRLVADPDYPLSRERFLRATMKLGGKQGFQAWLEDLPPEAKQALNQAVKARMVAWQ